MPSGKPDHPTWLRNSPGVKNRNLTGLLAVDLFRRQELENPHGPLATSAAPDRQFSCVRHVRWRRSRQQSSAEREEHPASPMGQKAEVADARESPREDMLQESAQKTS